MTIRNLRSQITTVLASVGFFDAVELELLRGEDIDTLYVQPFDRDQIIIIEEHHDNRGLFEVSSQIVVGRRECEPGVTIPIWGEPIIHASIDENSAPAVLIAAAVITLLAGDAVTIPLRRITTSK